MKPNLIRGRKRSRRRAQQRLNQSTYQTLEPRQLLATLSNFTMHGFAETFSHIADSSDSITANSTEIYTVSLEANQHLSVRIIGELDLLPVVSVSDPGGSSLGTSGSGDQTVFLQNLSVETAGDYVIAVSGFNGTVGDYEIEVLLNATFEESANGVTNDDLASAEPISNWIDPASYAPALQLTSNSEVSTTFGSLKGDGVVFEEEFASGNVPANWTTTSSTTGALNRVDDYTANSGVFSFLQTGNQNGTDNLNEAVLTIDQLAVVSYLSFYYTGWADETTALPASFTGSVDGDGISVSADGTTWYSIPATEDTVPGEWQKYSINLYEFTQSAGISSSNGLQVKFQQFGDGSLPSDGRAYDDIRVQEMRSIFPTTNSNDSPFTADDWYSFTVAEDQEISIASRRTDAKRLDDNPPGASYEKLTRVQLGLFDSAGALLFENDGPSFDTESYAYDARIDFSATPGTYYIRVFGPGFEDYSLMVSKNVQFENNPGFYPFTFDPNRPVFGTLTNKNSRLIDPWFIGSNPDVSNRYSGLTLQEDLSNGPIFIVDTAGAFDAPAGSVVFGSNATEPEGFQEGVNELRGDFANPVYEVSIDVGSDDTSDRAFLKVFSSSGVLLEQIVSGSVNKSGVETLTIRRPTADIGYFVAAGTDGDKTPLDNLEFFESVFTGRTFGFPGMIWGEAINISLVALGGGAGAPAGVSGSAIVNLYDNDGALVASGVDGVEYKFTSSGDYFVRVVNSDAAISGAFYLQSEIISRTFLSTIQIAYGESEWSDPSDPYAALAPNKFPFVNGATATTQNYTNYFKGINEIQIALQGNLSRFLDVDDFSFRVGKTNDTSSWADAPTPSMSVVPGQFSDVTTLIFKWDDGDIMNTWLQINLIPDTLNGLQNFETFYYGNVVGDVGDFSHNTIVNLLDLAWTRQFQTGFGSTNIQSSFDFNRDKKVNLVDIAIVRTNQSGFSPLPLITPDGSSRSSGGSDSKGFLSGDSNAFIPFSNSMQSFGSNLQSNQRLVWNSTLNRRSLDPNHQSLAQNNRLLKLEFSTVSNQDLPNEFDAGKLPVEKSKPEKNIISRSLIDDAFESPIRF